MTPRERLLALIVLGGVCLGGVCFLFWTFFLGPLRQREVAIAALREENQKKRERIDQVLAERPKLEWWRRLSLPGDADLARREYEKYLTELLRQSGFPAVNFSVTPRPVDVKSSPTVAGKGPVYTRLTFNVQAHGELKGLVEFLQRFYRTGLLQQVRNLSVQRPLTTDPQQSPRELDITLVVEALIVGGADNRDQLLPKADARLLAYDVGAALRQAPAGLALALWTAVGPAGPQGRRALADPPRSYASISAKNIFFGQPAAPVVERAGPNVDFTRYIFLTDITQNERRTEAFLYDRYNNRRTRLRASAGFDSFRFLDDAGDTLVHGQVVRIDPRDVIVKVDNGYYAIHIGQSLEEALRKPLTQAQIKEMGLAVAAVERLDRLICRR